MKYEEIPIISHEAGVLLIALLLVAIVACVVRTLAHGCRLGGYGREMRRFALLRFIKRERFYICLYLFFLFMAGHGIWLCLRFKVFFR